jgi:hypothetical protein
MSAADGLPPNLPIRFADIAFLFNPEVSSAHRDFAEKRANSLPDLPCGGRLGSGFPFDCAKFAIVGDCRHSADWEKP